MTKSQPAKRPKMSDNPAGSSELLGTGAMQKFEARDGTSIILNLSPLDRPNVCQAKLTSRDIRALTTISSVARNQRVRSDHLEAADLVFDKGICLSPYTIFKPLNKNILSHFIDISEFASDLREELEIANTFEFLKSVNSKETSQAIIDRILAVFSLCAFGPDRVGNVPLDFVHAVVDFFRSNDGLGWNLEILGQNGVSIQCVSNIIRGLARVFDDDSLLEKSRKYRRASGVRQYGWMQFKHSKNPLHMELCNYAAQFTEESLLNPSEAKFAIMQIATWLQVTQPGKSVSDVLGLLQRDISFGEFIKLRNDGQVTQHILKTVVDARAFSLSVTEQFSSSHDGRLIFDLVGQKEVSLLRKQASALPKPTQARARALPEKFIPIAKEILDEGEGGWPRKSGHFDLVTDYKGKTQKLYCPVIPTLLHAMLEVPLRMGQLRRLDSGEGDVIQFNADNEIWEANHSPLAGYWADQEEGKRDGFPTRGFACLIEDGDKQITGIFANTNKTGNPYQIPWYNKKFLKLLWDLRKWQEKYNPITVPLPPELYLDKPGSYSKKTKERFPKIFPVARLLPKRFWAHQGRIPTHSEIDNGWRYLLLEIQRRWNKQHSGNQVKLVEVHPISRQPFHPSYTLHGLRVRGLTNLRRGGMPLELLSRFVAGHASIVMTLYYLNFHPTETAEAIEKALENSSDSQRKFINDLKQLDFDEAQRRTVAISPTSLHQAFQAESRAEFCNTDIGVCPFDGTRCGDGGPLLRKSTKNGADCSTYGPVAPRNCVMCRHLISGPPWINQLLAYGTKLCERRQYLQQEQDRIDQLVGKHEAEFQSGGLSRNAFENKYESLQAEVIEIKDRHEEVENAIFNVEVLCNASIKLLDDDERSGKGFDLVLNGRSSAVEFLEVTKFEQVARITAAGRIHQILGDERVERQRDRYLDIMLFNEGITPPSLLSKISSENRQKAMDQFSRFLLSHVTSNEIDGLIDGRLRLRDLKLEGEVRKLLDVSLSQPMSLQDKNTRHLQSIRRAIL
jgi:hypothetical protein